MLVSPPCNSANVSHSRNEGRTSGLICEAVLGAKVIAAASTQEKLDISKKYGGADYVVNYTQKDWQKEVMKITGGKGVDVVYDPVGMIRGEFTHLVFPTSVTLSYIVRRLYEMCRSEMPLVGYWLRRWRD